jgi:hypothetical protein
MCGKHDLKAIMILQSDAFYICKRDCCEEKYMSLMAG